jgi:hypothetical protein
MNRRLSGCQTDHETSDKPAAEAALSGIVAAYETFRKEVDPVTAGSEGDRAALRRLPDVRVETKPGAKSSSP